MAETDALAICNEALVLLGEAPMDSFEGAGAANVAASRLYPQARNALLASHPWNFNRYTRDLVRLADAPSLATGFTGAYQLPGEVFRIARAFINTTPTDHWSQEGLALLVNADAAQVVAIEFHALVDETLFSPMFRQALVTRMAVDLALAVATKDEMAAFFTRRHMQDLAMARHANATQRPALHMNATKFQQLRAR
jgi:hypothetical protein